MLSKTINKYDKIEKNGNNSNVINNYIFESNNISYFIIQYQ